MKLKRALMLLALCGLAFISPACHQDTEKDKVEKVIHDIRKAAEDKDVRTVLNNVSKAYSDPQGNNYETLKGILIGYFYRYPKISAHITNLDIALETGSAKALFQAILTGRTAPGPDASVLPESLGMYSFDVRLNKEANDWKVVSAAWEKMGEGAGQ